MQSIIIGWQIYDATHDPFALGLTGLAEAIPFIVTSLFAGHVADKYNRKSIILLSITLLFTATLLLLFIGANFSSFYTHFGTMPIYAVIVITGIARGFLGPAVSAFWAQLVDRDLYANASTWNSTMWHSGAVIGPAIGGLICGFWGLPTAYMINALLFAFSLLFILFIQYDVVNTIKEKESLKESLTLGLKFVFSNQKMLGAISLDLFAVLFGGAFVLLPVFASEILKTGPEGLGFLRAAPAVGAIIMAVIMAYKPPLKNAGKKLFVNVALFGVFTMLFAISTNYYISLLILALIGAVDNVSVVIRSTILQLSTPDNMRGRVSSVNYIFIGSSNEIGAFESGLAARFMGLIPSVIFGGAMTIASVVSIYKLFPNLKKLDLQ